MVRLDDVAAVLNGPAHADMLRLQVGILTILQASLVEIVASASFDGVRSHLPSLLDVRKLLFEDRYVVGALRSVTVYENV